MAASHIDAWDLFNRKLSAFLGDLRPLVGTVPEYAVASSSVRMLAQMEPRKNQELFDAYVAQPYEERIIAKDEAFFLEHDETALGGGADNVGVVQLLRQVWQGLSAADKDAVWAHLQVLVVLNRRCRTARSAQRAP